MTKAKVKNEESKERLEQAKGVWVIETLKRGNRDN